MLSCLLRFQRLLSPSTFPHVPVITPALPRHVFLNAAEATEVHRKEGNDLESFAKAGCCVPVQKLTHPTGPSLRFLSLQRNLLLILLYFSFFCKPFFVEQKIWQRNIEALENPQFCLVVPGLLRSLLGTSRPEEILSISEKRGQTMLL